MKYLITESKMKSFLKDKFGVDLDGKIEIVTNVFDLPNEFRYITPQLLNAYLNKYGPMFVFKLGNHGNFLYQKQNDYEIVVNDKESMIHIDYFYDILGVNLHKFMGLSIDDLIDLYFKEEN